jgi:alkanesulfonate monooxygenase SsuD/methylene tetrahydromethanopterin reductase-like flavin-dependent oxidoreductase (luciferase family)
MVLLDHNLSEHLPPSLTPHEVITAKQLGWAELRNGDLLRAAERAGFDAMFTADQNIWYQQNNEKRKIALVVVNTNRLAIITSHIAAIKDALSRAASGSYEFLQLVQTRRKGSRSGR